MSLKSGISLLMGLTVVLLSLNVMADESDWNASLDGVLYGYVTPPVAARRQRAQSGTRIAPCRNKVPPLRGVSISKAENAPKPQNPVKRINN